MTGADINKLWFDGKQYFLVAAVYPDRVCLVPVTPVIHLEPAGERKWVDNKMVSCSNSINLTVEYKQ